MSEKKIKILSWVLILQEPLYIYGYKEFSLGFLLGMVVFVFVSLKRRKIEFSYPKELIWFVIYMVIGRLIFATQFSNVISLGFLSFILLLGFYFRYIDFKYTLKVYRLIALVAIVFFVLQQISLNYLGYHVPGLIPFLPYRDTYGMSFEDLNSKLLLINRSSSFFREPAAFAQFLLPLLAIELFLPKNRFRFVKVISISVVEVMIKSGNGYVGLFCLFLLWCFFLLKYKRYLSILANLFLLFVIYLFAFSVLKRSESYNIIQERSSELSFSTDNITHSGGIRVYRGYIIYDEMNFINQLFGLSNPDRIVKQIQKSRIAYSFGVDDTYFNLVQSILITGGGVGLLLFLLSLFSFFCAKRFICNALIILFLSLSFIASLYLAPIMYLFLVLAYCYKYQYVKQNCIAFGVLKLYY